MEVETEEIMRLERITVTGLQDSSDRVNVVLYKGKYYCIDDPILLTRKDKVKIDIIKEVDNESDLYSEYIRNNVRNPLNPYQLLLLYKEKHIQVPENIRTILTRNIPINNELLERLNKHLLSLEKKHDKPIFISLTVLDAISIAEREYIEKGITVDEIIKRIDRLIVSSETAVHYPYPKKIQAYLEGFYLEKKLEEEREEERKHVAELRQQLLKDVVARLYSICNMILVGKNGKRTETSQLEDLERLIDEVERERREGIERKEEVTGMEVIVFKCPREKFTETTKYVQKGVKRLLSELEKYGVTVINE